jgi:hypothetical protein
MLNKNRFLGTFRGFSKRPNHYLVNTTYRAFALNPHGPTQQKPWRSGWCSRQKSLIEIVLNWNTNMAAVKSCANALQVLQPG